MTKILAGFQICISVPLRHYAKTRTSKFVDVYVMSLLLALERAKVIS